MNRGKAFEYPELYGILRSPILYARTLWTMPSSVYIRVKPRANSKSKIRKPDPQEGHKFRRNTEQPLPRKLCNRSTEQVCNITSSWSALRAVWQLRDLHSTLHYYSVLVRVRSTLRRSPSNLFFIPCDIGKCRQQRLDPNLWTIDFFVLC